jgi:hypothetical protein
MNDSVWVVASEYHRGHHEQKPNLCCIGMTSYYDTACFQLIGRRRTSKRSRLGVGGG